MLLPGVTDVMARCAASHTATARDREVLQSGALKTSEIYTETFEQAGTFDYFCEFHPNLKGTVVVG